MKNVYRRDQRFWARRPLTEDMIIYAAYDVVALVPTVYEAMRKWVLPCGVVRSCKEMASFCLAFNVIFMSSNAFLLLLVLFYTPKKELRAKINRFIEHCFHINWNSQKRDNIAWRGILILYSCKSHRQEEYRGWMAVSELAMEVVEKGCWLTSLL